MENNKIFDINMELDYRKEEREFALEGKFLGNDTLLKTSRDTVSEFAKVFKEAWDNQATTEEAKEDEEF